MRAKQGVNGEERHSRSTTYFPPTAQIRPPLTSGSSPVEGSIRPVLPDGLFASQILPNLAYMKSVWPQDSEGL